LEYVRNSNPDGYTIAYMPVESTMLKALGFTDLSTDDFKFIGRAMTIPAAITVRSDSKWNTLEEFIEYAKENPGEIKVGNSGTGSIWHIAAASLEQKTGCQFTHVPFDGAAPAVAALLGRNI
jgi:tripartite-type tricarboxylate transporter receptor subunit TctC